MERSERCAAQRLRLQPTQAEALLWEALRERQLAGLRFRRQHAVGAFVLDFYCPLIKLVVELDGDVHDDPHQQARDDARTARLNAFGYRVLRVRNADVHDDLPAVLDRIVRAAAEQPAAQRGPRPGPRPQ